MEMEFCKPEMEMEFFGGTGNKNGTAFFGGTNAEIEFSFPTNAEFPFLSGFAWSI
jgi:hypothetical protein